MQSVRLHFSATLTDMKSPYKEMATTLPEVPKTATTTWKQLERNDFSKKTLNNALKNGNECEYVYVSFNMCVCTNLQPPQKKKKNADGRRKFSALNRPTVYNNKISRVSVDWCFRYWLRFRFVMVCVVISATEYERVTLNPFGYWSFMCLCFLSNTFWFKSQGNADMVGCLMLCVVLVFIITLPVVTPSNC